MDAAQKLLELSDEEKKSNSKRRNRRLEENNNDIVMAKIQEIFGKDIDIEVFPTKKQKRRYRSLVNIYNATRPVNDARGINVRSY